MVYKYSPIFLLSAYVCDFLEQESHWTSLGHYNLLKIFLYRDNQCGTIYIIPHKGGTNVIWNTLYGCNPLGNIL